MDGDEKKYAKRQMWARAYIMNNQVVVIIGQQVKSGWGWDIYKEKYWLQEGADHDSWPWTNYKLRYNLNEHGWHVTGVLKNGDGIIIGDIKKDAPIRESLQIFSNDMGWNWRTTMRLYFN